MKASCRPKIALGDDPVLGNNTRFDRIVVAAVEIATWRRWVFRNLIEVEEVGAIGTFGDSQERTHSPYAGFSKGGAAEIVCGCENGLLS